MRERGRIVQLESLRGLAALVVVNSHLNLAFVPFVQAIVPAGEVFQLSPIGTMMTTTPLNLFFNGAAAVRFFFVHSGFVLSLGLLRRGGDGVAFSSAAVRRYVRLALPVLVANVIAFALLRLHWYRNGEVGNVTGVWFAQFYNFAPDFWAAATEGAYGAFFWFTPTASYNRVLWTIALELQGSFLVFAFLALLANSRRRWPFEVAALALLWKSELFAFVLGMCLARLYVRGDDRQRPRLRLFETNWFLALCAIAGVWLMTATSSKHRLHAILPELLLEPETLPATLSVGAALAIWACVHSNFARRLLGRPALTWLGKLSYSNYLLHLPILCSVSAATFLYLRGVDFGYAPAFWLTAVVTHLAALAAALPFYWLVDKPAIELSRWIWQRWFAPLADATAPVTPAVVGRIDAPEDSSSSRSLAA